MGPPGSPHPTGGDALVLRIPSSWLILLLLGAFSQIASALLVRDLFAVFHGSELTVGFFYASLLGWIALGGGVAGREQPSSRLPLVLLLLPLALALQMVGWRLVRLAMDLPPGEFIPLGQLALATLILTAPVGLLVGFAIPVAMATLRNRAPSPHAATLITRGYLLESFGAMAGGVGLAFWLVDELGAWVIWALITSGLGVAAWLAAPAHRTLRRLSWIIMAAFPLLAMTPLGAELDRVMTALRFQTLHPGLTLLAAIETRLGHTEVARLGSATAILEDGIVAASFPDLKAIRLEAALTYHQTQRARNLLLFGGVASGLAAELLNYPVETVTAVVEDAQAFAHIRPLLAETTQLGLQAERFRLVAGDGRRLLQGGELPGPYDLIILPLPDPANTRQNRLFTQEFYQQLSRVLTPDGVVCTRVGSADNYLGREVRSYAGSVYHTLRSVFAQVAIFPGESNRLCASRGPGQVTTDPAKLAWRHALTPGAPELPEEAFYQALLPERVHHIRGQLQGADPVLNRDQQPATLLFHLMVWGKWSYSNIGEWLAWLQRMTFWPYLLPVVAWSLLALMRPAPAVPTTRYRECAVAVLALLGLVGMTLQLVVLFSYQARVGFLFSRIAWLNGVFMAGLALGSGWLGLPAVFRPALGQGVVLGLAAGIALLMPPLLQETLAWSANRQEFLFAGLALLSGLVTGAGYPAAVAWLHAGRDPASTTRTSGLAEAADHLGGAAGALLTGAIWLPILGVDGTSALLVGLILPVILVVMVTARPWTPMAFWRRRRTATYPWTRLVLLLWWAVLTCLPLAWIARQTAPGPQTLFAPEVLAQLNGGSGAAEFDRQASPFPHYLGHARGSTAPLTVSLATEPVAGDLKGYAGPINLLLALDREGKITGVRYLHSHETPSYIGELPAWLERLTGWDLARTPLALTNLDAMSGATVTSRAVLASLNRAGELAARQVWGVTLATTQENNDSGLRPFLTISFLGVLGLILLFPVVYRRETPALRLGFLTLAVLVLGIATNTMVTEVDLGNAFLGQWGDFATHPGWWLLAGLVVPATLLWGSIYCGYFCPFGALQELVSRLGERFRLLRVPPAGLERMVRFSRYPLLVAALMPLWWFDDPTLLTWNPMQRFFAGAGSPTLVVLAVIALLGSLWYFRYWCRWFCPLGAVLALGNRLHLLSFWAPKRRLARCDLNVRHRFDLDCFHCHRCSGNTSPPPRIDDRRWFLVWITVTFLVIGWHLGVRLAEQSAPTGGWRKIDTRLVQEQIQSGRLSSREAEWYKKIP